MLDARGWWQRLLSVDTGVARETVETRAERARADAERWLALREQEVARALRERIDAPDRTTDRG